MGRDSSLKKQLWLQSGRKQFPFHGWIGFRFPGKQMEDAFDLEKGLCRILEMVFPVPERGEYAYPIG